jgi:hypothetical protein
MFLFSFVLLFSSQIFTFINVEMRFNPKNVGKNRLKNKLTETEEGLGSIDISQICPEEPVLIHPIFRKQ